MKFTVDLGYYVSQSIEVEAEDFDEAINSAYDELDRPNISNKFEECGEVVCFGVYDEQGNRVYEGDI